MDSTNCEFLIVGGGIVGLTIANQLLERNISKSIIILDKEPELGLHTSGRNSGVLHAGIYYEPNSLKSKVCVSGANRLKEWMKDRGLKIKNCGKLIIPQNIELDKQLDILFQRGKENGASIEYVDENKIKELVPGANITSGRGIWSPNTSVVNPKDVINLLKSELQKKGVKIILSARNLKINSVSSEVEIDNKTKVKFGHFVNSAGLQADRIAHKFDIANEFKIIPFKGIYWKLKRNSSIKINVNLYPVPDLNVPFLGVHFTPSALNNVVSIGPTAIPAFGRENYNLLENIEAINAINDFTFLAEQYLLNRDGFRKYVHEQALHGIPLLFLKSAQKLIPKLKYDDIELSNKIGLRAQLFNLKKKSIVKDFLCLNFKNSTHIINSISPAFTASFAFADYIIDNYLVPQLNK